MSKMSTDALATQIRYAESRDPKIRPHRSSSLPWRAPISLRSATCRWLFCRCEREACRSAHEIQGAPSRCRVFRSAPRASRARTPGLACLRGAEPQRQIRECRGARSQRIAQPAPADTEQNARIVCVLEGGSTPRMHRFGYPVPGGSPRCCRTSSAWHACQSKVTADAARTSTDHIQAKQGGARVAARSK